MKYLIVTVIVILVLGALLPNPRRDVMDKVEVLDSLRSDNFKLLRTGTEKSHELDKKLHKCEVYKRQMDSIWKYDTVKR